MRLLKLVCLAGCQECGNLLTATLPEGATWTSVGAILKHLGGPSSVAPKPISAKCSNE